MMQTKLGDALALKTVLQNFIRRQPAIEYLYSKFLAGIINTHQIYCRHAPFANFPNNLQVAKLVTHSGIHIENNNTDISHSLFHRLGDTESKIIGGQIWIVKIPLSGA